jgi:putative ABC transport system substrate-binding protein
MKRREVIWLLSGTVVWAVAAHAQGDRRVRKLRVGYLVVAPNPFIIHFRRGMAELGHIEGVDYVLEESSANSRIDLLPKAATALAESEVDIIVAVGLAAGMAVSKITHSIPIVTLSPDPVRAGLANSFARPGRNVTGIGILNNDYAPKWLEILHEVVPSVTKVAVLVDSTPGNEIQFDLVRSTAGKLNVMLIRVQIDAPDGIGPALAAAHRDGAEAMIVASSPLFHTYKDRLIAAAADYRLPAMYEHSAFTTNGGLLSYGPDFREIYRRLAFYVHRIAAGDKPGDLPFEQPTKIELIINLNTAKALGLTIPPSLLVRADEVIE